MANLLKTLFNMTNNNGPTPVKNSNQIVRKSLQSKDKSVITNYALTNPSYSGCDMVATISMTTYDGKTFSAVLGELQTLSYSIHNEKAPVRNLGNVNARDYVTGPRTIAGSLVFAVFNHHWWENIVEKISEVGDMKDKDYVTDSIPPFDIVCSMHSELGYESYLVLYGVRMMNEGQVMSISDIFVENTYQYVATDIRLLKSSYKPHVWETDKKTRLVSTSDSSVLAPKTDGKNWVFDKNNSVVVLDQGRVDKDMATMPIEFKDTVPEIPITNESITI